MKSVALFLAILWAFACSLAYPCPKSLRIYLAAMLAANVEIQLFRGYGETSFTYATAYYIGTCVILAAMLNMVRDNYRKLWHVLLGAVATAFIIWKAWGGLPHPLPTYDKFYLLEGGTLTFCGAVLSYSAPHVTRADVPLTLGFLWLALAGFRLGFALNLPSLTWLKLNEVLPYVFVIGAMGWVGIRLRERRTAQA
jgi:hypothetical protein